MRQVTPAEQLAAQLADYDAAKTYWETFEQDDSRFMYPRKNYKYVTRLVHADGDTPEAIARATRYFDTLDFWLLRSEAYECLAEELSPGQAADLARKVYDESKDYLKTAANHASATKYDDTASENGTKTFENVLVMLGWAAATSQDESLIEAHGDYLYSELADDLVARGWESETAPRTAQLFIDRFEARLEPQAFCATERIQFDDLSNEERTRKYVGCLVCARSFVHFAPDWELIGPRTPCKLEVTRASELTSPSPA